MQGMMMMMWTQRNSYMVVMIVVIVTTCCTSIPVKRASDGKAPSFVSSEKMERRFVAEPSGKGTSARFHCLAEGNPTPEIEWLKNGEQMNAGNIRYDKVRIKRWTFIIIDLQPSDSGFYTCVVSNAHGSINATYQLDVIARVVNPPRLKPGLPQNTTAFVGDDVTLRCEVLDTDVLPHIQWMKQVTDEQISKKDSVFEKVKTEWPTRPDWTCEQMVRNVFSRDEPPFECIERDFTDAPNIDQDKLKLLNTTAEDSGRYTCLASNAIGFAYQSAYLKVKKLPLAPVFTGQVETHVTAYEGEDVRVKCPVKGTPRPDIVWSSKGAPIPLDSNKLLQTRQSLRILNTSPEDAGTYSCFVSNEHGQLWANFTVTVRDKTFMMDGSEERKIDTTKNKTILNPVYPQFISPERMAHLVVKPVGSHVRLRCNAEGSPTPTIQWLKNGKEIHQEIEGQVRHEQQKRWILALENIQLRDDGMYTCIVSNTLGSINMTYQLNVLPPIIMKPDLPKNITAVVGTTAAFKCDVFGREVVPHIQWLKHLETTRRVDDVIQKVKNLWLNHPDWPCDDIVKELFEEEPQVICLTQPPVDVTSSNTYQKKLYVSDVDFDDTAMYSCLVFNDSKVVAHGSASLSVIEAEVPELLTSSNDVPIVYPTNSNSTLAVEPTRHAPQTLPWKPTTLHFIIGGACIGFLITVILIVIICCCICRRRRARRSKHTVSNGVDKHSKKKKEGKSENIEMKYQEVKTNSDKIEKTDETCLEGEPEGEPDETCALRKDDEHDEGDETDEDESVKSNSSKSIEGDISDEIPDQPDKNVHVAIAEPDLSNSDTNSDIEPIDT